MSGESWKKFLQLTLGTGSDSDQWGFPGFSPPGDWGALKAPKGKPFSHL